ncbi:MAG: exodeoxyribonuclease VII large subunit [Muribaculaceae bacterium]|nr:exodeoxyribonuclease VII large subunit [Muribaculaceae bacterium]
MSAQQDLFQTVEPISLLDFNNRIKALVNSPTVQNCWIKAETSDVRVSTHCYLELVQKNDKGDIVARIGAVMWGNVFQALNAKFEAVAGQKISTGLNVMVRVSASFNEKFGLKVVVNDINPEFTLGDMMRQRMEIIRRLVAEGLTELNKNVAMAPVPQRIAVISAAGAAGYGDFTNQLNGNQCGVKFYTALFSARMQGENTVPSVMAALDRIESYGEHLDCVVIIRGGGSTSDLNSFDNYELAARVARCKLPVIVGIGHERDETVLDYVAGVRVKTPTAAAEFLIKRGTDALARLGELTTAVTTTAKDMVVRATEQLKYYGDFIPLSAKKLIETSRLSLDKAATAIPLCVAGKIGAETVRLSHTQDSVSKAALQHLANEQTRLQNVADKVEILSPRNILNRGFALAMHNGAFVTDTSQIKAGDNVTIHLMTGKVRTTVNEVISNNTK